MTGLQEANIEAGIPAGRQTIAAAWHEGMEAWGTSVVTVKAKRWNQSAPLGEAEL